MTETLTAVTRLLVLLFLVSSMSGIGLGLTLSQIIAPLKNVKLIALAVIMNFIIVPADQKRAFQRRLPNAVIIDMIGASEGGPFAISMTLSTLTAAGFEHYEVSNFASAGHRCRHNETYWTGGQYYAAGPGAAPTAPARAGCPPLRCPRRAR